MSIKWSIINAAKAEEYMSKIKWYWIKVYFFFFLEKDDETKNYRKDKILLVSLAMFVFLGISGRTG